MKIDVYCGTVMNKDNLFFGVSYIENDKMSYSYIQSTGSDLIDKKNAEILALDAALSVIVMLIDSHEFNLYHSFTYAIDKNGNVVPGRENDERDKVYTVIEAGVLEKLLYIKDKGKTINLIKIDKDKNEGLLDLAGNELGYVVNIDNLQIVDKELGKDYFKYIM